MGRTVSNCYKTLPITPTNLAPACQDAALCSLLSRPIFLIRYQSCFPRSQEDLVHTRIALQTPPATTCPRSTRPTEIEPFRNVGDVFPGSIEGGLRPQTDEPRLR